jgi:hypothetical protein
LKKALQIFGGGAAQKAPAVRVANSAEAVKRATPIQYLIPRFPYFLSTGSSGSRRREWVASTW